MHRVYAPLLAIAAICTACSSPRGAIPAAPSSSSTVDLSVKPPGEFRMYGQPASPADADSIRAVMTRLGLATRAGNAADAVTAYAEDAEWTNAFGRVKRDRSELEAFFRDDLFSNRVGIPGRVVNDRVISFRFVGADVAILHSYNESEGQVSPKGQPMGYRRTHHHFVLGKRAEGWRIVHHVVMDQRDTIP